MPELALALWLLYGAAALGIRVAIHLRRTGSTGLVGARSALWSLPWLAEIMHVVALGAGVAAPLLDLAGVIEPIATLDRPAVHISGMALFAVGLIGTIVGQAQMGNSWRIGTDPEERTDLVTNGPFALVRNPIYAALVPTLLGLALLVPNVVALFSAALFLVAVEIETRLIEEPHLLRIHGDAYSRYAARVGRFLPGLGRIRAGREVDRAEARTARARAGHSSEG
jgi:protein-S-isoprenylcysteine O-methyltransferase Ste14